MPRSQRSVSGLLRDGGAATDAQIEGAEDAVDPLGVNLRKLVALGTRPTAHRDVT